MANYNGIALPQSPLATNRKIPCEHGGVKRQSSPYILPSWKATTNDNLRTLNPKPFVKLKIEGWYSHSPHMLNTVVVSRAWKNATL